MFLFDLIMFVFKLPTTLLYVTCNYISYLCCDSNLPFLIKIPSGFSINFGNIGFHKDAAYLVQGFQNHRPNPIRHLYDAFRFRPKLFRHRPEVFRHSFNAFHCLYDPFHLRPNGFRCLYDAFRLRPNPFQHLYDVFHLGLNGFRHLYDAFQ